jgi:hypothetical protein
MKYDEVWEGEEAIERLWESQGGVDFDGMMWLTPRMIRISENIVKRWKEQEQENKKNEL